jgi:hypothetical protein
MTKNVQKGQKAPREDFVCEKCKKVFSRCVYHPYITVCPECRGKKKISKSVCRFCDDFLKNGKHKQGIFICRCERHWWLHGDGYYRNCHGDIVLYYRGEALGPINEHGDIRRLRNEHQKSMQK